MNNKRIASLIGLAMKAGKVAAGEFQAESSINAHRAKLLLLAEDASENTVRKFSGKANSLKIPVCTVMTKEELGRCIGKDERSVAVITDANFSRMIAEQINNN